MDELEYLAGEYSDDDLNRLADAGEKQLRDERPPINELGDRPSWCGQECSLNCGYPLCRLLRRRATAELDRAIRERLMHDGNLATAPGLTLAERVLGLAILIHGPFRDEMKPEEFALLDKPLKRQRSKKH